MSTSARFASVRLSFAAKSGRWRAALRLAVSLGALPVTAGLASVSFASEPPPGATACSGCHTPNARVATAVPPIVMRKTTDIATAMRDYKAGTREGTVMGRIAKGFSDEEIEVIAAWFAAQK